MKQTVTAHNGTSPSSVKPQTNNHGAATRPTKIKWSERKNVVMIDRDTYEMIKAGAAKKGISFYEMVDRSIELLQQLLPDDGAPEPASDPKTILCFDETQYWHQPTALAIDSKGRLYLGYSEDLDTVPGEAKLVTPKQALEWYLRSVDFCDGFWGSINEVLKQLLPQLPDTTDKQPDMV